MPGPCFRSNYISSDAVHSCKDSDETNYLESPICEHIPVAPRHPLKGGDALTYRAEV